MKTATVKIRSLSPYSHSQYLSEPKLEKERPDEYEERCWRLRLHTNKDGYVTMPQMAFKKALETAARFLQLQIPGRGKSQYTKHFKAGVMVAESPVLAVKADDVPGEWLLLNSDGVSGSGKRVRRCMPRIDEWSATVVFYILDDTITQEVFETVLHESGNFIGIGRFRPENGGYYGRFAVEEITWEG